MTEGGDPAVAGVQPWIGAGRRDQRIVGAVVFANLPTEFSIGGGAPETFDPSVFVRWDCLSGELSADPIRFLGDDDAKAVACGGERGGNPTHAAPGNADLALKNGTIAHVQLGMVIEALQTNPTAGGETVE
jgi:hypothetical protein